MSEQTIRIGGLFSETGVTTAMEQSMARATQFAIEQVNEAGGVNGREFELVLRNPDSTPALYAKHMESLIRQERLRYFFGCHMSSTRKAVLPIVERYDALLLYPVFYEGFEYSRNIIYTGATPNHNTVPLARYMLRNYGNRVLMIGSEYVYPYETNRLMSDLVHEQGGTKVGEYYLPLQAGPRSFEKLMAKVKQLQPSFILSTLVGENMRYLYESFAEAGFDPKTLPIASLCTSETEIKLIGAPLVAGHITAASYFQSVNSVINKRCIEQYRKRFGQDQVTDMYWDSAYFQVHLLAKAMTLAKSLEVGDVVQAMSGLEFDAPQGRIKVDADNHHTYLFSRIGRANLEGQFDILFESQCALKPEPYIITASLNDWSVSMERGS